MNELSIFLPGDRVRFKDYNDLYTEVCKVDSRCPKSVYSQTILKHAGESYIFEKVFLGSVQFQGIDQNEIFDQWSIKESYLTLETELTINDNIPIIYADGEYNARE